MATRLSVESIVKQFMEEEFDSFSEDDSDFEGSGIQSYRPMLEEGASVQREVEDDSEKKTKKMEKVRWSLTIQERAQVELTS